jgi:hypothetical protein
LNAPAAPAASPSGSTAAAPARACAVAASCRRASLPPRQSAAPCVDAALLAARWPCACLAVLAVWRAASSGCYAHRRAHRQHGPPSCHSRHQCARSHHSVPGARVLFLVFFFVFLFFVGKWPLKRKKPTQMSAPPPPPPMPSFGGGGAPAGPSACSICPVSAHDGMYLLALFYFICFCFVGCPMPCGCLSRPSARRWRPSGSWCF